MQARTEILDAMIAAIGNRQRLIDVVETAADADNARAALMNAFHLDEVQATAVLDLQVRRFTAFERQRMTNERDELLEELRRRT